MTLKKILQFSIGPIGAALVGVITLPLLTWYFSSEDIGRLSMMQVTLTFSTLLFCLGLDQAYVREFHEEANKFALFKEAIFPGLLLVSFCSIVIVLKPTLLSEFLFDLPSAKLTYFVVLAILATFTSRFLSLILRMQERGIAYSLSNLLPKLTLLAIILAYVVLDVDKSLSNLIAAQTISILFVVSIFAWNTRVYWFRSISEPISRKRLRALLKFGFPLIFGGIAYWGLTATDKIFLRFLASYEELGVYSVAVSFAAIATVLQSIFSIVWAPLVYKWASKDQGLDNVAKVIRYVLLLVICIFAFAGLFSWIISIILPLQYKNTQWLLIPCLAAPLLYTLSEATKVGIGISRRSYFGMLAAVMAFCMNLIGNWLLIPALGARGAAISTCLAFTLFFVLRTEFSIRLWRNVPRKQMYGYVIFLVTGAILSSLFGEDFEWLIRFYWILVLSSVFLFFRMEVSYLWLKLLHWVNN